MGKAMGNVQVGGKRGGRRGRELEPPAGGRRARNLSRNRKRKADGKAMLRDKLEPRLEGDHSSDFAESETSDSDLEEKG